MNEPVYIGVFVKSHMFCVMQFLKQEDIRTELIDSLHDQGFTLKSITEKEYKDFDEGDEVTAEELVQAWKSQ